MAKHPVPAQSKRPASLDLVDTNALFKLTERLKAREGRPVVLNYNTLLRILEAVRRARGFRPADQSFAPAAIDTRSDSQKRFITALTQLGMVVDPIDYRVTFITAGGDDRERSMTSLGPYLTYIAGLIAGRENPELVLVTGSFEPYLPLLDFTSRRDGKALLCYFRAFLDPRWSDIGRIFEPESAIKFYDLTPDAQSLLGVPLVDEEHGEAGMAPTGLGLI